MGYIDPKLVDGATAVVESFTCAICFNLFEKPRTACSKGHTFCLDCLTAARARAPNNCPTCREDSSQASRSKPLENMLDELRIRCCHGPDATTAEERGAKRQRTGAADAPEEVVPGDCCKWVGRVADYPAHLANDCQLAPHACPFYGCAFKGTRKELAQHYVDAAAEHASEACAKIESLEALLDETVDDVNAVNEHNNTLGESLSTLENRVGGHDTRIRNISNSVIQLPQLKQQASSLKFFQNCTVVNLDFALDAELLKAVYRGSGTRTIELGSCNVWSGLDLQLGWLVRKCPVHGTKSHSLILDLVSIVPDECELINCFGRFAPVDKDAKTLTFNVNSRGDPLVFSHKKMSKSLFLGTFDQVLGQARFLHSDGNYYVKARLHFSSPFREGNLSGDPAICTIYVKKITGSLVRLKARPGDTILSLKQKIRDTEGIPLAQQRLVYKGRELIGGSKLYESNIFDGAYVDLQLRLAGN